MPYSTTRKSSGMGSIRKKTVKRNGKEYTFWEARFTAGYDPKTGKQIQRSISGKTQREVREKLKKALLDLESDTYIEPCEITVGEWLDTWIEEYLSSVKVLTKQNYANQVNAHLKPCLGGYQLGELNTHTIQRFYNDLQRKENLSPKTVKNIHGVLHSALQQAIDNGYIHRNPTEACKLPKVVRSEINPLEPFQITQLLQEAQSDSYKNLFTAALFTGMRQGELLGLSWDCVNFDTGIITVKRQLQCKDGEYFMVTPKNGKARAILPAPLVMEALREERIKQQTAQQAAGKLWDNPFNLVFTDACGKNLVRRTVVKHFKAIAQRTGLDEKVRFHDLRHSFAVTSLQAGDDIKTVQANLGHATAAFTLQVYAHVNESMRRESADRMQKFYETMIR